MLTLSKIALTIGAAFFLPLLLVAYVSKHRQNNKMRSKIYRYLLVFDLVIIGLEIGTAFCFGYNVDSTISYLLLRIRHFADIIYFTALFFYYVSFARNEPKKPIIQFIKEYTPAFVYTVFAFVCAVIYCLLPFKEMDAKTYMFMPGLAYYFIVAYCVLTTLAIVVSMAQEKETLEKRKIISLVYLVGFLLAIIIFQSLNPDIAILGIAAVIHLFSLYFVSENPDLDYIEEIGKLTNEVERASKTKSDFLSNMSHEIRTPMNAIVGFSETVLNDTAFNKEEAYTDIKHIESSSRNLLEIINNILDISKIESGKETLDEKEYSVANIVMELSSIIEARIETKHIKLEVDVDKGIASRLYGDSTKMFQVLLNILTNSVKYTEVGKIRLTLTHETDGTTEKLKFKISDTGFGIKKDDYDKMFEKFSRLDIATTNEIEGTGLGLVITKRYVDLMGGTISFESEYGVGTTFFVEIPQKIVDKTPIGDYKEAKQTNKVSNLLDCSSYRILVVDDNKLNLKVAQRLLSAYKFQIDLASSGKECVYKYKEGTHYDMIFLDHMMPEMDGIEALHIIKKLEGYDTPVMVVLTANAITGVREMYLNEGFDEYLSKPIDTSELNKIINKYFRKKEIYAFKSGDQEETATPKEVEDDSGLSKILNKYFGKGSEEKTPAASETDDVI